MPNKYEIGQNKNIRSNRPMMGGPRHGMGGEKSKNFKGSIAKLIKYSKRYIALIIIAIICAIIGTVFSLIGPDKLKEITNLIVTGFMGDIDMPSIWDIARLLITLYAIAFVLNFIQGFIMATVSQKLSYNLREDISDKINKLPLSYFDKTTYGNVLSRVTNDVDTIGMTLNRSLVTIISAITMFFGSMFMMFKTNWILALAAIVSSLIGFVFMGIIISHSQKFFRRQQQSLGSLNGYIEEIYAGQTIVKAFNGEKKAIKEFNTYNDSLYTSGWKSQFFSGLMMPLMAFIGNFGYVVVAVLGSILVVNDMTDFGVVVAFMIYIRLFTQPLSQFAQASTSIQSAGAASERVFEFLEEKELADESKKSKRIFKIAGDVDFSHVNFGYNPDKTIIHDFNASVRAGEKIAIVGPTGAGKTTIVNLLMRFYELNSGVIKIDGTPTTDLTRENVHRLFGMVLQDTWLFEGTIRENIVYNKKEISNEMIEDVAKTVGIDHYIQTLPNKYDTILTDKLNMSQGQKQLLTIARAMIQNAPLLIFDEATSSVDTRTEILIQNAMDNLMKGRTTFVIAHRLSTIKNADLILVINDGDIVESGNHNELLAKNGFYTDLYNSQFDGV